MLATEHLAENIIIQCINHRHLILFNKDLNNKVGILLNFNNNFNCLINNNINCISNNKKLNCNNNNKNHIIILKVVEEFSMDLKETLCKQEQVQQEQHQTVIITVTIETIQEMINLRIELIQIVMNLIMIDQIADLINNSLSRKLL